MRIAAMLMVYGLVSASIAAAQPEQGCRGYGPTTRGICNTYCNQCFQDDGSNCDDVREEINGCGRRNCAELRQMFTARTGQTSFPCDGTPGPTTTATATATFTPIFTATATSSPTGTATETPLPTETLTPLPTETFTPIATATSTSTPEGTATETPLPTATFTPIFTSTATSTATGTATETPLPTATFTPIFTSTATSTATGTATETPPPTETLTPIATPTGTSTPEGTATETPLATHTFTPIDTPTGTVTPAATETPTPAPTDTATQIATFTATAAAAGFADEIQRTGPKGRLFVASLSGADEVPSVATAAEGRARFLLSRNDPSLRYRVRVKDIADVTMAHIHCGAPGVNGPVVAFLFGPVPTGVTPHRKLASGTIGAGDVIAVPDSPACPGGVASFDELLAKVRAGATYVNVHTLAHGAGEIRGAIQAP